MVGQRLHDLSCVPQIPVWSAARFNWGSIDVSALLAYAGILLIVSQSLGVWLLIPRYGEYRVLLVALCAGAVQMVLFGLSYKPWMMYGTVTVTVPWVLATPCVRGLLAKSVPRHEQGRLQGTEWSRKHARCLNRHPRAPCLWVAVWTWGLQVSSVLRLVCLLGCV